MPSARASPPPFSLGACKAMGRQLTLHTECLSPMQHLIVIHVQHVTIYITHTHLPGSGGASWPPAPVPTLGARTRVEVLLRGAWKEAVPVLRWLTHAASPPAGRWCGVGAWGRGAHSRSAGLFIVANAKFATSTG